MHHKCGSDIGNIMGKFGIGLGIICFASILCGCVATQPGSNDSVIAYQGPTKTIADVAIMTTAWPLSIEHCNNQHFKASFHAKRYNSVAILPGNVDADVFAEVPLTKGIRGLSMAVKVSGQVEAGHKYRLFGSWIPSNESESISTWVLRNECTCEIKRDDMRPEIDLLLKGVKIAFKPTLLDVTTDQDVRSILASDCDWRIKMQTVELCYDAGFLAGRLGHETNRELRHALKSRVADLTGKKVDGSPSCTYVTLPGNIQPATVSIEGFRPDGTLAVITVNDVYDPGYRDAKIFKCVPGTNTFRVMMRKGNSLWSNYDRTVSFSANQGRNYILKWSLPVFPPFKFRITVCDGETGAVLADTSQDPAAGRVKRQGKSTQ